MTTPVTDERFEEIDIIANIDETNPLSKEDRAKLKSYFVQIGERALMSSLLDVKLPSTVHGQWVRRNKLSVDRMRKLGYKVDTQYAVEQSRNSDGTSIPAVADVVFMVCPKEVHEIHEEIYQEELKRRHAGPDKSVSKKQAEEKFFEGKVQNSNIGDDIPTFSESKTRMLDKNEFREAMDLTPTT